MSTSMPNGTWAATRLSAIAHVIRGRVKPQDHPELPFVGMDNVEAHTMRLLGTVPSSMMKSASVHFRPGDVLYGRLRPYLNKVLAPEFEGLASAEFIPLTTPDGILPTFLQYRLNAADFVTYASHLDEGDRPRVDYDQIGAFEIELPPSGEQLCIVEAIESYFTRLDDAVATLERVQRNLKRYRASVLKAAVEGRLVPTEAELARFGGRDYEPASVLLERIRVERRRRWEEVELAKMQAKGKTPRDDRWKAKYTEPDAPNTGELPDLPDGWCWVRAEQCVYSRVGHAFKSKDFIEDGVRLLRGDNIGHGELRWDRARRKCIHNDALSMHPHLHLATDDIVLAMDRPLILTGLKMAKVRPADLPALLVQRVIRLRPAVHREYVLLNLHSEPFMQHLDTQAKGGGVPHVSEGQIKDFIFPLPPLAEQERISREVERLVSNALNSIAAVDVNVRRCSRLRQSILKWAFEGLLVDQDPTDEPASRLLERIQAGRESTNGQPRRSPRRPGARSPKA